MPHPSFSEFNNLIFHLIESFKEDIEENKDEYENWEEQYEDFLNYRINDDCAWAYFGFVTEFNTNEICYMMKCFDDYNLEINWENTRDADLCNIIIHYAWMQEMDVIEEYGKKVWGIEEDS